MKKFLVAMLFLVVLLASCAPAASQAIPKVRLHDRDASKSMFTSATHTRFVDDIDRTLWEWQQHHPCAEILLVGVSVGLKVVSITVVYQQSDDAAGCLPRRASGRD